MVKRLSSMVSAVMSSFWAACFRSAAVVSDESQVDGMLFAGDGEASVQAARTHIAEAAEAQTIGGALSRLAERMERIADTPIQSKSGVSTFVSSTYSIRIPSRFADGLTSEFLFEADLHASEVDSDLFEAMSASEETALIQQLVAATHAPEPTGTASGATQSTFYRGG